MAGHSKWAQIKRKKGIKDKQRGTLFSKLSRAITIAVVEGGSGDPDHNIKLRMAIEKAKEANMPKDNIERAIEKGSGPNRDLLKEVVYEGFGPEGTALLILTTTDNSNRTYNEVRNILDRHEGKIAQQGATSYLFELTTTPEINYKPLFTVRVENKESAEKLVRLMETLEEQEDVQDIFTNADIPEEYLPQ